MFFSVFIATFLFRFVAKYVKVNTVLPMCLESWEQAKSLGHVILDTLVFLRALRRTCKLIILTKIFLKYVSRIKQKTGV
jgi:hypothetical protein